MTQNKVALVLGATGLVGKSLVNQLINDDVFSLIKLIVRRTTGVNHPKIQEFIVDFDHLDSYKHLVKGDVLFSSMGTTIKQAGSKEAQYKVDFTYQYEVAKAAKENGVSDYLLVSSSGANAKSKLFYPQIKGALDKAVMELSFNRCIIFRPSVLVGDRPESRMGEKVGATVIKSLSNFLPFLRKYKPIKGEEVAQSMIASYKNTASNKVEIYTLDELFDLISPKATQP